MFISDKFQQKAHDFFHKKDINATEERKRLLENESEAQYWKLWGPYLSERQWGTVREDYGDYSNCGEGAWNYFSHHDSLSRAYRWGEDGIAGISDDHQYLCFALSMWNERDPIIKEKLFGLTNDQGNHGEDVKEYYYYLDSTPTHSYMEFLYKYPYEFPYGDLVNNAYKKDPFEYELIDTGALNSNSYFDIFVKYAKNTPRDMIIEITATNRGTLTKRLHLLPMLWFRNTWSWGDPAIKKPGLSMSDSSTQDYKVIETTAIPPQASKQILSPYYLYCKGPKEIVFTENETNRKNQINDYIVKKINAVSKTSGTRSAIHYDVELTSGSSFTIQLRLTDQKLANPFNQQFSTTIVQRKQEADQFYQAVSACSVSDDEYLIQRQAFAGMLWSKQLYYLVMQTWLRGDPNCPAPQKHQQNESMKKWEHMYCNDIMSMPDKWEYPWFAAWDLAFHTVTLAMVDPEFAKKQLLLMVMEWFMHPNGQISAYEWDFSNVNPPVHAWATYQVYQIEKMMYKDAGDLKFLERVFNKLNQNFTWWVNKVDSEGNNVFEGGFLGLDNIRLFDKGIEQADGTAWIAMYCLNMSKIASELSKKDSQFQDLARKYLQHFLYVSKAMNTINEKGLWDKEYGFYFDCVKDFGRIPIYSLTGLIPLFAIEQIEQKSKSIEPFYGIDGMIQWYTKNRQDLLGTSDNQYCVIEKCLDTKKQAYHIAMINQKNLKRILSRMLKQNEFLADFGIRSLSKIHENGSTITINNSNYYIKYEPAESQLRIMGGNSNWRGPVWFPINYLLVQSLRKYYNTFGDQFTVEFPEGSGQKKNLNDVADELSKRLINIFKKNSQGYRPCNGGFGIGINLFQNDPQWRDLVPFYEYFHPENGAGLGASHQTGWTGLVANLIQEMALMKAINK